MSDVVTVALPVALPALPSSTLRWKQRSPFPYAGHATVLRRLLFISACATWVGGMYYFVLWPAFVWVWQAANGRL